MNKMLENLIKALHKIPDDEVVEEKKPAAISVLEVKALGDDEEKPELDGEEESEEPKVELDLDAAKSDGEETLENDEEKPAVEVAAAEGEDEEDEEAYKSNPIFKRLTKS